MHLYLDNSYYFITCKTKNGNNYFHSYNLKIFILKTLYNARVLYNLYPFYFSILNNHYHFLTYIQKGKILGKVLKQINGNISRKLSLKSNHSLWEKYYDQIIETEESFLKTVGYVTGNPLKHGLVKNLNDLQLYQFCNFKQLIEEYGKIGAIELVSEVNNFNWE